MKFRLYREYGALNSKDVFDAFSRGLKVLGHTEVNQHEDISVIWSVLWKGRMASNRLIYENAKKQGKSVIIIEVGNLKRGNTWRLCIDNINGDGEFSNDFELDADRPKKLGVILRPPNENRKKDILICSQLSESLQWQGMPPMEEWIRQTVREIRKHSDRKIVVRPHPRSGIKPNIPGTQLEIPKKIVNSYDDFDIDYGYHCVINHNSGPAVQSAIAGTPIICDRSSLAYDVSEKFENIEKISLPCREQWFLKLCHTEWSVQEISSGIPLERLLKKIIKKS